MKWIILLCSLLGWMMPECLVAQVYLNDHSTGQAIPYAQIVDDKGNTLGMTDADGVFPDGLKTEKMTVQHLSYYPRVVELSELTANHSIGLTPKIYSLDEVEVSAAGRDFVHLRTYFRSYQMNDSCMKYYRDGFADFFISLRNHRSKRYLSHLRDFENSMLIRNDRKRASSMVDKYIVTPYLDEMTLIERLKHDGWTYRCDSLTSRLCRDGNQAGVVRTDTANHLCMVSYDALEGKKEVAGSLFGFSSRLVDHYQTETYRYHDYQSYMDLINRKWYRKIFYKYKKDPKEQMVEVVDELYVLDSEYVTTDEMKRIALQLKQHNEAVYPKDSIVTPLNDHLKSVLKSCRPTLSDGTM